MNHQHHQIPSGVRIQKARTTLLLDHPFFGTLLFRLGAKPSRTVATMATNGISLFYNPGFVETLNAAELAGVLAHEVMHLALQHHTRRSDRNQARWNMACDYAINPMLLDAGVTLPKDVLIDDRFRGMSAERIYNLMEEEKNQEGSSEQAESKPRCGSGATDDKAPQSDDIADEPQARSTRGGVGQVLDAPAPVGEEGPSISEQAREWQIAVEQAESVAKLAGKLPAGAVRTLEAAQSARVDWRELLRRAWSETTPADYSWMHPTGGMSGLGFICPGSDRKEWGKLPLRLIAPGRSARDSWASSRRRFGPSWRDSALGSCMCSTLTRQFTRSKRIRQVNLFLWYRLAAEARIFGLASTGSDRATLCPRAWCSLPICVGRFPAILRRIR